jgi:hypothetical protein
MALVKLNNRGVRSATTFGSISALGEMRFIKKQTASSSSTISFIDGTSDVVLDDTYKEYLFTFNNIHPETDQKRITFQVDTGTNTSYNQTITSSTFQAYHNEGDTTATLEYVTGADQAQGTAFQMISDATGNANDECVSGYLHLFDPSNTTFVKHFIARTQAGEGSGYSSEQYTAGYINTTTALTRVQFKMSDGDIDAGDICLYGIN